MNFMKNKLGFSIAEMIVVLGILGTLSVLSIASIREGNDTLELDSAVEEFINQLTDARVSSLSGKLLGDEEPLAYGVQVDDTLATQYVTFASFDDNGDNVILDAGEEIDTRTYQYGVSVINITAQSGLTTPIDIAFENESGKVYMNGVTDLNRQITILFQHPVSGLTRTVEMSPLGFIGDITRDCNNGVIEIGEECDPPGDYACELVSPLYSGGLVTCLDENQIDQLDNCTWDNFAGCAVASSSALIGPPNCGDGIIQVGEGEECDDGGQLNGNGCSAICEEEADCFCSGQPSVCSCPIAPPTFWALSTGGTGGGGGGYVGSGFSFGGLGIGGFGVGGLSLGGGCYVIPDNNTNKTNPYTTIALIAVIPFLIVLGTRKRLQFIVNKNDEL